MVYKSNLALGWDSGNIYQRFSNSVAAQELSLSEPKITETDQENGGGVRQIRSTRQVAHQVNQ